MGQTRPALPAMLICAISSRYPEAFEWSLERLEDRWGRFWLVGERFEFGHTQFYTKTMGDGLQKQLVAFEALIDPGDLASIKNATNQMEADYENGHQHEWPRPLNLDPGYVTEAKLVLATVKNRDHRIYLSDGIYAEVTLSYYNRQWNGSRWTYPDYLTEENLSFLSKCRDQLRQHIHRSED